MLARIFAVIAMLALGCGAKGKPAASGEHTEAVRPEPGADVKPPGEAKVGDTTTCPVMKHTFVVTADSPSVVYKGKTYYFCCPGCVGQFNADPEKFIAN